MRAIKSLGLQPTYIQILQTKETVHVLLVAQKNLQTQCTGRSSTLLSGQSLPINRFKVLNYNLECDRVISHYHSQASACHTFLLVSTFKVITDY